MTARQYDINGWFEIANNPISREGVFPYSGSQIGAPDPGRVYRVLRPASELARPETLDSFRLVPIIDDHTMLGERATPAEAVGVDGVIGENIHVQDGVMKANLKIFSRTLAEKIKSGKTQLSCGYRCVYDFTPGVWNGQAYDAVQRQITGNHLALVDEGRMGPSVAVLDQMTFTVDAKEQKPVMDEAIEAALDAIQASMGTAFDTLKARLDKLEAGMDEMAAGSEEKEPDGDEGKEGEDKKAMDAMRLELEDLRARVASMDGSEKALMETLARKNALADRVSQHFGTFDHSSMTYADVVKYGADKLGTLKDVPAEALPYALDAALSARPLAKPVATRDSAKASSLGQSIAAYAGA